MATKKPSYGMLVAPLPPSVPCSICQLPGAGAGGLCSACAGLVVPGGWTTVAHLHAVSGEEPKARLLPREDMRVEDVIGWRIWSVVGGYLGSITAPAIWLPGEPMEAAVVEDHGAATNGIHVFKEMAGAIREAAQYANTHNGNLYAIGSVLLWGDVVEHERGYRAERAMILSIDDVLWQGKPPWHEETKKALAFLRERYGVGASVPRGTTEGDG